MNEIAKMIDCLNRAFSNDPAAIHALICNRVPCNQELAEHPNIPVDINVVGTGFSVGALGLLNGALDAAGMQKIAIKMSDEKDEFGRAKMLGFCEYSPKVIN